jgi:predicted nucleic acid-binding protein
MILVDTSVWVDHFRDGNPQLTELLNNQEVLIHPFVLGELSLGLLKNRNQILELLSKLPQAPTAEHEEVMAAVARHKLFGVGIGWVDAHLVASSLIASAGLLTMDKSLQKAAQVSGVIPS